MPGLDEMQAQINEIQNMIIVTYRQTKQIWWHTWLWIMVELLAGLLVEKVN